MKSQKQSGFTLIELLISVVILSAGLIAVYRPLLASLSALHYTNERVEASRLITEKFWEMQTYASEKGALLQGSGQGTVIGMEKIYHYSMESKLLDEKGTLYEVIYSFSWTEMGRYNYVSRVGYILLTPK